MNRHSLLLIALLFLGGYSTATAQTFCPPNIDFEFGNTTNWNLFAGTVATGPAYLLNPDPVAIPGLQTIESAPLGFDYYGGFPVTAPGGGNYALKLGHDTGDKAAQRAIYYVTIPPGTTSYSLVYHYAVVLENPPGGHTPPEMPRLVINAFDTTTGDTIPCISYTYISGLGTTLLPGFVHSTVLSNWDGNGADVYYKPWTAGNMKFPGLNGDVVAIQFTANGCTLDGHFGYGYVDMSCGLFAASTFTCGSDSATLDAPAGYSSYQWFDSTTFSISYGNTASATIAVPTTGTTYAVICIPFAGYGCPDTLYTHLVPTALVTAPSHDTTICAGTSISLSSNATDISLPLSYIWSPSTPAFIAGLSCNTCDTVVVTPTGTTAYTVTTTDAGGCQHNDVINVTVVPNPGIIIGSGNACIGSGVTLTDATGTGVWGSLNTSIATVASTSGTTATVGGVATGIATITYSFGGGLCSTGITVTVNPQPPAISGPTTLCIGTTASLTDGAGPGTWTSSSAATATVGSTSGIVYGTAPGMTTITYTAPSGCPRSVVATVISLPPAITGTRTLCQYGTTALTDAGGGTWSSSNTGVATAGSTGIITGVTANTATIVYSIGTGCTASAIVTVDAAPTLITGTLNVCAGLTTQLSDITTGGTWVSSNTSNATVGPSGLVTGGAITVTSTSIITYTAPGGCPITVVVTINPSPAAILPIPANVCYGSTILLNGPAGGTWSSGNTTVATIGSTGIAGGVAALGGPVTITYTLPTGCKTTAVLSVNPLPGPITGTAHLCEGGATTTLSDATAGGTWISNNNVVASVNAFSGLVTSGATGTDTINYTLFATGCTITTVVTVNPVPPVITGVTHVCAGATTTLADGTTGGTWSSAPTTAATVGSSSGIVTGAAVTATTGALVTYTAPTGCSINISITVNPPPPAITAAGSVFHLCGGQSIALADAGGAGTWLSSHTNIATVTPGPTSGGIVTGVLPGVDTIIFTESGTQCMAATTITVNATPGPVSGNPNVCVGSTTSLSDPPGGGTWTSSNATVASAGLTTGVIGGVGVGTVAGATMSTATITYSLGGTCTANIVVTVHALPAVIAGTLNVCAGASTVLTDPSGAGTWTSSNTAAATIGSTSGIVIAGNAGTSTITFTAATGCAKTAILTVNALPASCPVTGGGAYCAGGLGVHIGLGCSSVGTTYHPFDGATALPTVSGTGSPLDFGAETGGGIYTVTATTAAGCSATMPGSATVTVNPLPAAFTVTGGGGYCTGGTGVDIGLNGSAGGVTYQLYNGGAPVAGDSIHGTGAAIDFGLQTATGVYTIIGTDTLTGCPKTMTGSKTVTVNPVPVISGAAAVCINATLPENAPGFTGGTWSSSAPTVATINSTTGAVTGISPGLTTTITYTSAAGCTATKIVTVSVSPGPIGGPSSVCFGSTATETDTVTGGIWSVTPPTSVATIGSISGVVTAGTIGMATITYSLGTGCTVTRIVTVTVAPAPVIGAAGLCQGFTTSLSDPTGGGTWSSSHTTVATVSSTGMVTADSTGTAIITYTLGGCTATLPVTVNIAPGAITGGSVVCVGATTVLSDGTGGGTWTSSNSLIASVNSTGDVRGVGVSGGTATITYSLGGTCVATEVVTVSPVSAVFGSTGLCVGTSSLLGATPTGGTWLSGNPSAATVSGSGTVVGVGFGTSIITYTTLAGCPSTTTVTVNSAPSLITGTLHVCAGMCTTLLDSAGGGTWSSSSTTVVVNSATGQVCTSVAGTAVITYSLGFGCTKNAVVTVNALPSAIGGITHVCTGSTTTLTDIVGGGAWSSSNTAVASVVTVTAGTIMGVIPGTATITYAPSSGCSVSTTVTVNPLPGPVTGIPSMCVGATTTLGDSVAGGVWSSSNTFTATVNPSTGLVRGNNPGTTTVSYTLTTGCQASVIVTVLPPPPPIAGPPMVCAGQAVTLHDSAAGGAWFTGPSSIATIDPSGVLWGVSSGTVIVSYTVGTGCSVINSIIVNPLSPVMGDSVVCAGLAITLTDTTQDGTWSSSNTAVATAITVNATTGLVTGVASGATTVSTVLVTYSLATGCAASRIVTVNPAPPAIGGVMSVCSGSTTTLTDTAAGGTWSSVSDIATVTSTTGVVGGGTVGITGGTAMITYTLAGTGCPAVAVVTVNPLPPAIGGPGAVCIAATDTLTDGVTGGVWASSFTSVASIDPATGIVTGGTPGSTTITYTLPTGCSITDIINVTAPPLPIGGPLPIVCPTAVITLTDATTGGVWSSSVIATASVDGSGNVTGGIDPGEAVISYSIGAGCSAFVVVTVNAEPDAIYGTTTLCQGTATTLTDGTPGGIWTSSDTTAAVIDSLTGAVNIPDPGTAGGVTITYTAPTGCSVTALLNVNPAPLPISGFASVCLGFTTSLSDGTTGGVWSSSNTTVAPVDGSGTVTGGAAGTSVISYSSGICAATVTVTVNLPPAAITGTASVCYGLTTALGDTPGGGTWSSSDTTIAEVDLFSGVVTGESPVGGTADITYSLGAGCTSDIIVTVNPLPAAMTGTAQVCATMSAELFDATGGGAWSSSNTEVAAIVAPTAGVYTGIFAGTSTISYTLGTSCAITSVITVNPMPTAITGPSNICIGSSVTLADGVTGGAWSSSATAVASVINSSAGAVYGHSLGAATISYILPAGCTSAFAVNVVPLPAVYTLTGGGGYCAGGTGVDIGLNGSAVGVNYLLYNGVTATGTFGGTGSALNFGLQSVSGPYTVIAISTSTGCTNIMAGSAAVTIMPTTAPSVSITSTAANDTVCSGTSATFTAVPVYGGTAPTYQWNVDGVNVGTGAAYTFVPANGDVVAVTLTSNGTCPSPATASNSVEMTVLAQQMPVAGVTVTPGDAICLGNAVTLTAAPLYGGTLPTYEWIENGVIVGTGAVYTYIPADSDMVYLQMTSNYICRLADTILGSTITITVDTPELPLVTINGKPGTSVAIGAFDTLTAVVTNGGTSPSYQWMLNEIPVAGATTNTYISNNFQYPGQDSVTCIVTNNGICKASSFAWVYISVHPEGVTQVLSGSSEVSIQPNPNKGEFTIQGTLGTTTDEEVSLEITDMLGQVVYKEKVIAYSGKINKQVTLGKNIANGMYMLNMVSGAENKVFHIVIEQ